MKGRVIKAKEIVPYKEINAIDMLYDKYEGRDVNRRQELTKAEVFGLWSFKHTLFSLQGSPNHEYHSPARWLLNKIASSSNATNDILREMALKLRVYDKEDPIFTNIALNPNTQNDSLYILLSRHKEGILGSTYAIGNIDTIIAIVSNQSAAPGLLGYIANYITVYGGVYDKVNVDGENAKRFSEEVEKIRTGNSTNSYKSVDLVMKDAIRDSSIRDLKVSKGRMNNILLILETVVNNPNVRPETLENIESFVRLVGGSEMDGLTLALMYNPKTPKDSLERLTRVENTALAEFAKNAMRERKEEETD
jgi:hypothetical protein